MISGKDLVVIGGDFARYPSSAEHLIRRFVPANRVIWVETIGMRRPTLSWFDAKRAVGKLARLGRARAPKARPDLPERLSVVTPVMWPFHDVAWVRQRNEASLVAAIRAEIARRGFRDFALIATVPLAAGLGRALAASFVVYYCVDDWALWPGLLEDAIPVWEKRLLEESAVVATTSEQLRRAKSLPGKPAHLLPHGVDVSHFAKAGRPGNGPVRRLTYFGLFDARTDQEILGRIARARPDVTVEIIGPVQVDVKALKALPNVEFKGPVPYSRLPEALRPSDALLLPYRLDQLSRSINPLKIRESLATGKPVVAMALAEVQGLPGLIQAKTADEFVERCLELVDGTIPSARPDLSQWLAESSWESRAEDFSRWLEPHFRSSAGS